jgi:hypothetical protein
MGLSKANPPIFKKGTAMRRSRQRKEKVVRSEA